MTHTIESNRIQQIKKLLKALLYEHFLHKEDTFRGTIFFRVVILHLRGGGRVAVVCDKSFYIKAKGKKLASLGCFVVECGNKLKKIFILIKSGNVIVNNSKAKFL